MFVLHFDALGRKRNERGSRSVLEKKIKKRSGERENIKQVVVTRVLLPFYKK